MAEIEDLKKSAEKLAETARESYSRLAADVQETAKVGIEFMREQSHKLIQDPAMLDKVKEMEKSLDAQVEQATRQVEEATKQIEEGAKQLMAFIGGFMETAKTGGRTQPEVQKVEVEVEPSDKP